jgi:glucosyl-3-phosphoglycerate synthase
MGMREFHHSDFSAAQIARERERRGLSISVCLPARECAETIASIVLALEGLREQRAIDEVVVVDAASDDGTADIAAGAGARVAQEAELIPECGEVLGKGDAMWRALSVVRGDLVCFLDADTEEFQPHFATGLLGALVCASGVSFAKAFYRRPMAQGEVELADGGGRVNHLVARPALELFYPELACIRQPLAGEIAATRELLERIPFATGYGVEIGMLIDVWREVGLEGIAQVDLEEHHNRHQPLQALTPMARTVLATIAARLVREGRLLSDGAPGGEGGAGAADAWAAHAPVERPPLASVAAA